MDSVYQLQYYQAHPFGREIAKRLTEREVVHSIATKIDWMSILLPNFRRIYGKTKFVSLESRLPATALDNR